MRGLTLYRGTSALMRLDSNNPASRRMVVSAQYRGEVMLRDTVTVTVASVAEIAFQQRDYIIYDEHMYFLNRLPKAKMASLNRFEYTLEFEGGMYELSRARFDISSLSPAYGFDLFGDLYTFCSVIVASMNKLNGGNGWYLDFEQENGEPVCTKEQNLTYERENCLAVLQDLVTKWPEWEWRVEVIVGDITSQGYVGGTLSMRRKSASSRFKGEDIDMAYGRKGGLTSIEKVVPNNATAYNRVYFFGGNRNVLGNYRWPRVLLPSADGGSDSYLERNMTQATRVYERVEIVDSIYPGNKPFEMTSYEGVSESGTRDVVPVVYNRSVEATVDGTTLVLSDESSERRVFEIEIADGVVNKQTGQLEGPRQFFNLFGMWRERGFSWPWGCDYAEWLQMYGVSDSADNRSRYDTYYVGHNCYIATENPTITFQTGQCAGMTFDVWNGWWSVNEDGEATCTLLCLCQQHDDEYTSDDFTPVEIDAQTIPNNEVHPADGDKFTIAGIYMPPRYLYYAGEGDEFSAEGQLNAYAEAYMEATANVMEFSVEVSEEWVAKRLKENGSFAIRLYDGIAISGNFMEEYDDYRFRTVAVERDLLRESYGIRLSANIGSNALKIMREYLKDIINEHN